MEGISILLGDEILIRFKKFHHDLESGKGFDYQVFQSPDRNTIVNKFVFNEAAKVFTMMKWL
jgi:hypothetical protein